MTAAAKNFPSEFAPLGVKASKNYQKQYCEAFHSEAAQQPTDKSLFRHNKNYARWRKYGRGEQGEQQYKEMMSFTKGKNGTPKTSFRNLNFEVFKFMPKIRNVLINKMMNQPFQMKATAIDPRSISEKRRHKARLIEFMINQEQIAAFQESTKIGLDSPISPGEMPPANLLEIDPYMDMNPKDTACMEVLDFITQNFYENNWEQLGREIAGDLVDCGVGGTRQWLDYQSKIRFRRIVPERCITNICVYPDFRDLIRFAEYVEITIGDLRRRTKGQWGQEVYQKIANEYAGEGCKGKYTGSYQDHYSTDSYAYAYDHERITIMETMYYSTDTEVYVEYLNGAGNMRVKQESSDYIPFRGDMSVNNGQGLSDEEYNTLNAGKKKISRVEVRNVYQCAWIVGSEYVFENGIMPNQLRPSTNWQESIMPVTLITTDFQSTMGLIEQPADQVQLNFLHYQNHLSASKPPGLALEKRALAMLSKGGKSGKKWDPKEALIMWAETGSIVYHGYDENNQPLISMPFKELVNGMSEGVLSHYTMMKDWITTIRSMIGLNDMTEGNTPPERLGKTVAEMAFGASDNALSHLVAALRTIYKGTAKNVFYLLQNNIQRMNKEQFTDTFGAESYKFFSMNVAEMDLGLMIDEGPDDKVREKITQVLNLMVENGQMPGEDAALIEMEKNPYRQILLIRKHRKEMAAQKQAEQEHLMRVQGEENTKTAVAVEQAKQQMETQKMQAAAQTNMMQIDAQRTLEQDKFGFDLQLRQLDIAADATQDEKDRINVLLGKMIDGQNALKKQREANKKKSVAA